MQILGHANDVLNLTFPTPIPELVHVMRVVTGDLRDMIRLDCCKTCAKTPESIVVFCSIEQAFAWCVYREPGGLLRRIHDERRRHSDCHSDSLFVHFRESKAHN